MLVKLKCGCVGLDLRSGEFLTLWDCSGPDIEPTLHDSQYRKQMEASWRCPGGEDVMDGDEETQVVERLVGVIKLGLVAEKTRKHIKRLLEA